MPIHRRFSEHKRFRTHLIERLERRDLLTDVSIVASRDNSLFEDAQGTLSNGAGDFLFTGRTKQPAGRSLRRALVAFDLEGQIPAGATINSVSLSLHMSMTISEDVPVSIHRLTAPWGEGTSDAAAREGKGATATPGDSTWLHQQFPSDNWTNSGGDFLQQPSATTDVGAEPRDYVWSSERMLVDVQNWLANPDESFGWIVLGDEDSDGTAKRFNSKENSDAATRPTLTISFTEAVALTTVAVDDVSINEGADSTNELEFTLSLSGPTTQFVTIDYVTEDLTANAGEDYTAASGTVVFAPNDPLTKTISVTISGDTTVEPDEQFQLQLTVTNAEPASVQATGTILNDDGLVVRPLITIADANTVEGTGGNTVTQLDIRLSAATTTEVSVDYATMAGTASNDDFVAANGTITFAPGESRKTLDLFVVADDMNETDESFLVEFSNPTNAVLSDNQATITIVDDDDADSNPFPWQNPELARDVSNDGAITPRDAVLIINYLNTVGAGPVPADTPPPFYDVSGDNQITPRDALLVINFLNANAAIAAAVEPSKGDDWNLVMAPPG